VAINSIKMNYTWPEDYPRLFELYREAKQRGLNNFFQDLAGKMKKTPDFDVFRNLEEDLSALDSKSWADFKSKVFRCSMEKQEPRGYSQLVDCLNEVKGYLYLKEQGYSNIEFIPESSNATPDIRAISENQTVVLLEVKTIHVSDEEIRYLIENTKRIESDRGAILKDVSLGIPEGLKNKLMDSIGKACRQLLNYEPSTNARRIAFLIITLDIALALDPRNYKELSSFLDKQNGERVEVRYCYIRFTHEG